MMDGQTNTQMQGQTDMLVEIVNQIGENSTYSGGKNKPDTPIS